MAKKRKNEKYTSLYRDRHGRERCVFRRNGFSCQLPHPEHPDYRAAYDCAFAGVSPATASKGYPAKSIGDLCERYFRSPAFLNAGSDLQRVNRGIIEPFRVRYADVQVSDFTFEHIERILVAKSKKRQVGKRTVGGKVASRNLQKQIRRLFKLAVRLDWIKRNPVDDADGVKQDKSGGFHTWTDAEIIQYRQRWAIGTMARAALEIMLWTWQRRGDAHRFGPEQLKAGKVRYTQAKTGKSLWLPAAPQMLAAIEALPAQGIKTFIITEFGKPFTKAGFGNKMREWCDAAGLPHCSAHGIRKAAARRAAELGATNQQLKAAGGWSNDHEVSTYTAGADQERMSAVILNLMIAADKG